MSENMYSSAHIVDKRRVAAVSVIAAFFLCILKLFVGLWTGSLGLLSDAAHSGLDFLAALMTFVSVSLADRPADPSHPYGHQKFDNLAALFEALLLAAAVAWIVYEAIMRLFFKAVPVTVNIASFAVLLTCICIDYLRCTRSSRAAKQTGSAALEANAYHFLSDIATSFVVLIGLVGTSLGYPQADAVCALAVSALILSLAYSLAKKAIDALTDRVPDDHIDEVRRTALTVPGVGDVYDVRVRHAGNRHFIDLKAGVSGSATLDTAHAL
ncbi:MAG: cation diffusion facilitator family transporter, partial [Desulfobacterota bacterium]|nr:cation diffusion facilitator family transporter [Thermodesulfobacteriota bacterium]